MLNEEEEKPHVARRPVNRVSSAVWPLNVQRVVATGRAAQRRRDWIIQGRRWVILADLLPRRMLQVLTTLLVVASSLTVAVLGLRFWFLLPLPLLLFLAVLTLPLLLASSAPLETIPTSFSGAIQESHGPADQLPSRAQEPQSYPGFQDTPKSKPGLLTSDAPATPKPAGQPLVRVLETYDLRQPHISSQLTGMQRRETGHHRAMLSSDYASRQGTATTRTLDTQHEIPEDPADR